jgi:hypothetical protein
MEDGGMEDGGMETGGKGDKGGKGGKGDSAQKTRGKIRGPNIFTFHFSPFTLFTSHLSRFTFSHFFSVAAFLYSEFKP